ncbi:SET domain-containing protein [Ophiobolus disseminans]|uniref:SET domain-containing protein n=1 Tax=Ophiobolus disseminans TaxID=1469910 RepID=A0A6A6ZDQ4_9PLEO|nr:SET domain-containing protein [Ophiobolus disseminans]
MLMRIILTALPFLSLATASKDTCEWPSWQDALTTCHGPPSTYTVKASNGKGLGLFSAHDLDVGEIVMRETPPLKISPPEIVKGSGYPMPAVTKLVRKEFDTLSSAVQDEIMSLTYHITSSKEATMDKLGIIFRTNAYNSGKDIGLFPKIARINHSCRPNASYYWSDKLNKRIVYATRKIKKGEEVYVSYIPLLLTQEGRQKLLDRYGFKCSCDACAQERAAQDVSDERRTTIQKAFADFEPQLTLEPPRTKKARQQARKNAKASLQLTELVHQEGLADYFAKAYRVAAISHARVKDWKVAAIWANKGYELKYIEDPDSPYTMEMHNLTSNFIANWESELQVGQ